MIDTMSALMERRSVRRYLDRPVPRALLEQVLQAGVYAPSALGDQNRQLTALVEPSLLTRLNDAVFSASDEATKKRITDRGAGQFSFFYRAPVLIVVSDCEDAFRPTEDCACCLENMFLAAHALGLGSCWINQLTDSSFLPEIRAVLTEAGVPPTHRVYGCCALGYTDGAPVLARPKTNRVVIVD